MSQSGMALWDDDIGRLFQSLRFNFMRGLRGRFQDFPVTFCRVSCLTKMSNGCSSHYTDLSNCTFESGSKLSIVDQYVGFTHVLITSIELHSFTMSRYPIWFLSPRQTHGHGSKVVLAVADSSVLSVGFGRRRCDNDGDVYDNRVGRVVSGVHEHCSFCGFGGWSRRALTRRHWVGWCLVLGE
jgi:hypothetical protein